MSSTLGQRIRIIRKSNILNQVEFSNYIGVSQGTLSELEMYKPERFMDFRETSATS
ncbi:helix-turn-helix domain-containing protein [Paenibacillus hexagrammi]|uniref:Helix-turn-helix domain-containing protein n=1 Tax=Paenibacillus hexagrammi TaxID=2908839 RepID=A0ABY3SKH0_9BACL|nr:helix-turn-helix transcriptional regulator [Paenibacillus sp. YPD9-1]UJF33729.1 helix-turn-helix domain-containing protein [Paenibacillus sp. YPD9-1]